MSDKEPLLFYESFTAALRDDCKAIEPSRAWAKVVGKLLFPEKDPESAARALDDKLNPNRRDRFTDEQERLIMRKAREARGFSAALNFICDDTDFERPKARDPADEMAELQRRYIDSVAEQRRIAERMERLARAPIAVLQGRGGA